MSEHTLRRQGDGERFDVSSALPRTWRRLEAVIRAARERQRRRRIAIVAVLVIASALAIYFSVGRAGTSPSTSAKTTLAVTRFPLHGGPVALASADRSVWVVLETNRQQADLLRLNPLSGKRIASYLIGRSGPDFGAATSVDGVVYATAGQHLIRVDPRTSEIKRVSIPGEGAAITVGYGSVWVASIADSQAHDWVTRLNMRTLSPQKSIPLSFQPVALQAGLGSVWLASTSGLWRIAATTNRVTPTNMAWQNPVGSAVSGGRLWIIQQSTLLVGLDRTGRVRARIDLPFYPGDIAATGTNLWVTNNCGCMKGLVALLDSRTGYVVAERPVGETPVAVTTDAGGAWVATFADGSVSRVIETH